MRARSIFLPGLALGGAALLLVPGPRSYGFSKIGGSLSTSQRDFRVYNNFADAATNNNTTPDPEFPGWDGAEEAIWKGVIEWGSEPHGDGTGDPTQNNLGDGGANFDPAWMGHANGIGTTNNNILSAITSCGGNGTLAYTETPINDGWRIRFCDEWVWGDGPGAIGRSQFDLQGVACHEYGHALGLGHSTLGGATMYPATGAGSTAPRSINGDDISGVQCVYGVKSPSKPYIYATQVTGGTTINIYGQNFDLTNNEVWFTNKNTTATGADPIVKLAPVASTGHTFISVAIPTSASPGDVLVKIPGGTTGDHLSNAFPTDLVGTFGNPGPPPPPPLMVMNITPSTVEALDPGTAQTVTIHGQGFTNAQTVTLNLSPTISPSHWTIVDDATITVDLPLSNFLGLNALTVDDGTTQSGANFTIVAPTTPKLELGTGDDFNTVQNGTNMNVVVGGEPGETHTIYYSTSPLPSTHPLVCFDMGNGFTNFFRAVAYTVGSSGWTQDSVPVVFSGPTTVVYCQSVDLSSPPSPKYDVSNLQIITLAP